MSKFVTMNVYARIFVYIIVCALVSAYTFLEVVDCEHSRRNITTGIPFKVEVILLAYGQNSDKDIDCIFPWHMSETCALSIIMSFLFLRIHLWIKFLYASTIVAVYAYLVVKYDDYIQFQESASYNINLQSKIAHLIATIFLTFTLHLIDRQTNYLYRLDYQWNEKLLAEQKEANKVRIINVKLLTNILPLHVAKKYLNVKRPPEDFYHEDYSDVAVMFASIINYPTISKTDQMHCKEQGIDPELNILAAMNDIFVRFDNLTVGNKFGRPIEKIKITKWTYMAACGLAPGVGVTKNLKTDPMSHTVITLLRLASAMMKEVPAFNRGANQDCQLRIGISYGKVVAGVVGSKKPLYDIWGDTVNMASRMDTTGLPNQIQVLEETANIIQDNGYRCNRRGKIRVKGKENLMMTYLVALDEEFNLIKSDTLG